MDLAKPLAKPFLPQDTRLRLNRARKSLIRARLRARTATSGFRLLPDVLIVGAMRGGTTSLYKYLSYHPRVAPSLVKEVEYFSKNHHRGLAWYSAHFPLRNRAALTGRLQGSRLVTLEASPYYLFHPHAAARAAALVPSARIVVLLRDPVARAYSHYQLMRSTGHEPLSFVDAIEREHERIAGESERVLADPEYDSVAHHRWSYFARGLYAEQLQRWMAHFPSAQILVLKSEDLYADPARVYRRVLEFVGLPPWQPSAFRNISYFPAGAAARRRSALGPFQETLQQRYAPHNARLRELTGIDFGWAPEDLSSRTF